MLPQELWKVEYDKDIEKQVFKFRSSTKRAFIQALGDLKKEGPWPHGWDVKELQNEDGILRLKLDHRHRMIYSVFKNVLLIRIIEVVTRENAYR